MNAFEKAVARYQVAERELAAAAKHLNAVIRERVRRVRTTLTSVPAPENRTGIFRVVQLTIAEHYGVPVGDLLGHRRKQHLAHARQVAMVIARTLSHASYEEIGLAFGGRDHGTVIHAEKAVQARCETEPGTRECLERLTQLCQAALGPEGLAA